MRLEAKEKWLNDKCETIEKMKNSNTNAMYENIKEITGKKPCTVYGCIKDKSGKVILEKEKVLDRWAEYISDLFDDTRGEKLSIKKDVEGPKILRSEVHAALSKMKSNKAPGPDKIVVEEIKCLDEFSIEKVTEILNEIYDSDEIPEDLSKSIYIALPKKPNATKCELHRTINLMSHLTNLLRILIMRARSKIRPEISNVQRGFVEDCGTRNAIFMLRMISERAIEMKKDLFICFVDYTKAFDSVKHVQLMEILENLDIDGKDTRVIKNLYWNQRKLVAR